MRQDELTSGRWTTMDEPVLAPTPGGWDGFASMTPVVFSNREMSFPSRSEFGMLYVGAGTGKLSWGIGYAESDDLRSWKKHPENPLIIQEDEYAGYQLDAPCILKTPAGFMLICEEKRVEKSFSTRLRAGLSPRTKTILRSVRARLVGQRPTVVNHALGRYFVSFTTADPLNWDIRTKRVVFQKDRTPGGSFDCSGVFSPQVYMFEDRYHMFYGGTDGRLASTGLAVADRLNCSWRRLSASPILSPGGPGEWDEVNALIVSVVRLDDCYAAFYEGEDRQKTYRIGLAFSRDLKTWTKWRKNPVIEPGPAKGFSEQMVCGPRAFSHDGRLYLFFNAHRKDMSGCSGMAAFNP